MTPREAFAHRLWCAACAAAQYGQDKARRIGEVAAEIQMEGEMLYTVTDPFCGDQFDVTEDEKKERQDHFALQSQNAKTESQQDIADKWFWAYWRATPKDTASASVRRG